MDDLESTPENGKRYRVNGVTHYFRKGVPCACNSKRPHLTTEDRDKTNEARTEGQVLTTRLFRFMSKFLKAMFRTLGEWDMWAVFARKLSISGRNLCHRLNAGCCDPCSVFNFRAFIFSVGWLSSPVYTSLRREGMMVALEWEDRCDRRGNHGDDVLMVGYFYESYGDASQLLRDTGARRGDKRAEFSIPFEKVPGVDAGEIVHVYPFFARPRAKEYSCSLYFLTWDGMDEVLALSPAEKAAEVGS